MTYCLKNSSRAFVPNIVTSALLPFFSRLALTLSSLPMSKPESNSAETLSELTFLHDFIKILDIREPDTMVVSAARQLARLDPDNTLVLLALLNQDRNLVVAGRKPSPSIKKEILKLRKKQSALNPPLEIMDATDNEIGSSKSHGETISVAAATEPGLESDQFILYSTSKPASKEFQLFNYCLQHLKKRVGEAISRQDLEKSARLDALTGLHNRRHFDEVIKKECERAERYQRSTSLIMLDLDYFKQVNDTLGHQAGDEVLKNMAKFMIQFTRKDVDHVCRMGGDEFAIVFFAETDIARRAAEKILKSMDGKVSIGIGFLRADDTVETLIARTDESLYEAKERGRGQVVIDNELEKSREVTL